MFGSSLKERKNREVYQNGTAFRSFANFEDSNLSHREAMEDCNPPTTKNPSSTTAFSKTVPSPPSSACSTATGGRR